MRIEVLVDVKTTLGESAMWDAEAQRLYWVDSLDGRIFRCTPDGAEVRAWEVPASVGSMVLRAGGGAVLAMRTGLHFLDTRTGEIDLIVDPEPDLPGNTMNDGKVDARGRLLVGTMDTTGTGPSGSLYRLDPDLSLHTLERGFTVSNGPCWSPDARTFYFTDSAVRDIWAYDYDLDAGEISHRRVLASADAGPEISTDGSTVDAEGFIWNCLCYAGRIVRYAPDGTVDRVIDMPSRAVTSVMFGGADLDVLYVTSMGRPLSRTLAKDSPTRGAVYAIHDLGIRGLPEHRFAG